jgi:hypothetical protein
VQIKGRTQKPEKLNLSLLKAQKNRPAFRMISENWTNSGPVIGPGLTRVRFDWQLPPCGVRPAGLPYATT